jgi:hypothetical protein
MSLKQRGVYRLPNGRELVVLRKRESGRDLFMLASWEHFELREYEVNAAGRLMYQGKLTAWGIADLRDTGRTVQDSLTDAA